MEMYKRLEKYKQEHNSTCVPTKYDADPDLGNWVTRQRQNRYKKERMGKERLDLLNKIGFAWKGTYPFHFEQSVDGVLVRTSDGRV